MAKTWSSHGPSNWFFLNLNHCAQGCSTSNFTLLGLSCSPHPRNGQNMALLWPKHVPHRVLNIGSSWILINVARDMPWQIPHFWVYPVAPFPRNGKNMALLWPKHGLHMVLQIVFSWFIINLPRDAPCQISHFWVYPGAPFLELAKIMHSYGQNMVLTLSLKWVRPEP